MPKKSSSKKKGKHRFYLCLSIRRRKKNRRSDSPETSNTYKDMRSHQIGESSEVLIFEIISNIIDAGELDFPAIKVTRTVPNYPKVDIFISTEKVDIPVQVKTSPFAEKRFRSENPHIFCIATANTSREELYRKLVDGLNIWYQKLQITRAYVA